MKSPLSGLLLLSLLLAVFARANTVFSDNFNDNSIDPAKWTTSGTLVTEETGLMQVMTIMTDNPGTATSKAFPIADGGVITIERRVLLHYDNSLYYGGNNRFFTGYCQVQIDGATKFGIEYVAFDYSDSQVKPTYGFFVTKNGARATMRSQQGDVSQGTTAVWDRWFTERIQYDPLTGELKYYIDGTLRITYNVGASPVSGNSVMRLKFQSYGWWVGHFQQMDDLTVNQARVASVTFYRKPWLGELGNVFGHAFVSLTSMKGTTTYAGFYPEKLFSGAGCVISDEDTLWDYSITYVLSEQQYRDAVSVVINDALSPPRYSVAGFNCMTWVGKVASAADVELPPHTHAGIADPLIFGASLESMGDGTVHQGGKVTANPIFVTKRMVSSRAASGAPFNHSFSLLEREAHRDAAALAASMGIGYQKIVMGDAHANDVDGLELVLTNVDLENEVISVDWGDGSAREAQSRMFSHVYAPGSHTMRLMIVTGDGIFHYEMKVDVSSAPRITRTIDVGDFPPANIVNTGLVPLVIGPDFLIMNPREVSILPDNKVQLEFDGVPQVTYTIEATDDLTTPFLPVATVVGGADGVFRYAEALRPEIGRRFFRARFDQ